MLDIKNIKYEETVISDMFGTITMYFIAPKEELKLLYPREYPEAESTEISICFPADHIEPEYAYAEMSPTANGSDYDWWEVTLTQDEIKSLIELAKAV